jgi:hypothetical protein
LGIVIADFFSAIWRSSEAIEIPLGNKESYVQQYPSKALGLC